MADARTRPDWWPRWVPPVCRNGHPLLPGGVASHWVNHECPANEIHVERVWQTLRDSAEKFREEFADRTRRVWES